MRVNTTHPYRRGICKQAIAGRESLLVHPE
ncbi:MAG: hypothetical protein JWN00_1135, partial [Actinomycetia bacterium]|nr:hypothetical protein [Actinomycetes bacterium]